MKEAFKKILLVLCILAAGFCLVCCNDHEVIPGSINLEKKIFASNYLGLQFKMERNWVPYSLISIAKENGYNKDLMTIEDVNEMLDDSSRGKYLDFRASTDDNHHSVDINYQRFDLEKLGYGMEQFAIGMADNMPEDLEKSQGITNGTASVRKVTIAEEECYAVKFSGEFNTTKIYIEQIYILRGDNMAIITIKSWREDKIDSIVKLFDEL